jgi:sulfatase modifying factor 1
MYDPPPATARLIKAIVVALIIALGYYLFQHFHTQPAPSHYLLSDGKNAPPGMVWLPGGVFMMGSNSHLAKHNEMPAHPVRIDGFWVDQNDVTNAQFAQFVQTRLADFESSVSSGYTTTCR